MAANAINLVGRVPKDHKRIERVESAVATITIKIARVVPRDQEMAENRRTKDSGWGVYCVSR